MLGYPGPNNKQGGAQSHPLADRLPKVFLRIQPALDTPLTQLCSPEDMVYLLLFSLLVVSDFSTPWTVAHQSSLSFPIFQSLLELMSIELVMPSSHLVLCCPLLLLPSIFPSIRVFYKESTFHIRWPKYWSFNFSISLPMNIQDLFPLGLTGLISLMSKGVWRVFSNTTVQKHQFFDTQPSLWSNSHICTWLLEKS